VGNYRIEVGNGRQLLLDVLNKPIKSAKTVKLVYVSNFRRVERSA